MACQPCFETCREALSVLEKSVWEHFKAGVVSAGEINTFLPSIGRPTKTLCSIPNSHAQVFTTSATIKKDRKQTTTNSNN